MTDNGFYTGSKHCKYCELRYLAGTALLAVSCFVLSLSAPVSADESLSEPLLPNQFTYYNPLKHGTSQSASQAEKRLQMDNESLFRSAEQIRSDSMSAEQRALNHQWLMQSENEDSMHVGGRVFSTLMRMGFKTYWEGNRARFGSDNRIVPDSQGGGRVTREVDYRLRVSGDDIKLSFEYEF